MNARSLSPAVSDRLQPDLVGSVVTSTIVGNALVQRDGATALVATARSPATDTTPLTGGSVKAMEECTLLRPNARVAATSELGVDVLSWGSLDDFTADGNDLGGAMWTWDSSAGIRYSKERGTYLHLESDAHNSSSARQIACSTIPADRWFDADGAPLDGSPRYTLQLAARRGDEAGAIRVVLYDVNDTDPTVEPTSTTLHEATIPLPLAEKDEWSTLTVDLTEVLNVEFGGVRPDALLLYVIAPSGDNRLDIDDIRLFEWRPAAEVPDGAWIAADAMLAAVDGDATFDVLGCG